MILIPMGPSTRDFVQTEQWIKKHILQESSAQNTLEAGMPLKTSLAVKGGIFIKLRPFLKSVNLELRDKKSMANIASISQS